MGEAYDAHTAFEARLERLCTQHPSMRQHVHKRRQVLSVYTDKELTRWFETSGYSMPELRKTDERLASRRTRADELARLQSLLQRTRFETEMAVAQRCRGWTPQT